MNDELNPGSRATLRDSQSLSSSYSIDIGSGGSGDDEETEAPLSRAARSVLGPVVYNIAFWAMNVGLIVAVLAGGYLIYGLLSGQLADLGHLTHADRLRILANVHTASRWLTIGVCVGSLGASYVLWGEEYAGYGMVVGALLLGIGVPQTLGLVGSGGGAAAASGHSDAYGLALAAFPAAMMPPLVIGGLLVLYDVAVRLIRAFQDKSVRSEKMTFGQGAAKEASASGPSHRTVPLGKCWQGPYCRDFLREHCPIFVQRKACWRVKQGCYCEPDIVNAAADRVQGVHLEMAPDAGRNFANPASPQPHKPRIAYDPLSGPMPAMRQVGLDSGSLYVGNSGLESGPQPPRRIELTMAQKRERCRNCVIYNEHQREKYQVLLPVVILGTIALIIVFSASIRELIGFALTATDHLVNHLSFLPGDHKIVEINQPSDTVEWLLTGAITLMVLAKVLQFLEWALFKIKI